MSNLDQDIINLAKAIRQAESGGNYNAVGDAGTSTGAYQFQKDSWKQWAGEYLGDPNAEQSKKNQNMVAYYKIKSLKDKGYNPAQIAAAWNAGEGSLKNDKWKTNIGRNAKLGVDYDTPAYVEKVRKAYTDIKGASKPQKSQYEIFNQEIPEANVGPVDKSARAADLGKTFADAFVDPFRQAGSALTNIVRSPEEDVKSYTNLGGKNVNIPGYKDGQEVGALDTAKQAGGVALGIGSTALPFLKYGKFASMAKEAPVLTGAGLGYAQDVSESVKGGEDGLEALVPGVATAAGGGLGVLAKGAKVVSTPTAQLEEEALARGLGEQVNRTKKASTALADTTITRKTDAGDIQITPIETINKQKLSVPEVNTEGGTAKVNWSKGIDEIETKLDDAMDTHVKGLGDQTFSASQLRKIATAQVNEADISLIAKRKAQEVIDENIDTLKDTYKDSIPAKILDDERRFANREWKKNRVDTDRILGDTYRDVLYNYTDTGRAGLADVAELTAALKFMRAIDGGVVKGGGLGRYVAQMIGASVGNQSSSGLLGLGPILGAIGGNAVSKGLQKLTFISPTAKAKGAIEEFLKKFKLTDEEIAEVVGKKADTPTPKVDTPKDTLRDGMMREAETMQKRNSSPEYEGYTPDQDLPSIDMGPKVKSKYNKSDRDLPTIKGFADSKLLAGLSAGTAAAGAGAAGYNKLADKYGTETYTREEAPVSEEQGKPIEDIAAEIATAETRGEKQPYSFSQWSSKSLGAASPLGKALGKYQITSARLKEKSKSFLGRVVSDKEFLASPALQDAFIKAQIQWQRDNGLSDEEIIATHRAGWGNMSKEHLAKVTKERQSYIKSSRGDN